MNCKVQVYSAVFNMSKLQKKIYLSLGVVFCLKVGTQQKSFYLFCMFLWLYPELSLLYVWHLYCVVNAQRKSVCISELLDKFGIGSAVMAHPEFGICMWSRSTGNICPLGVTMYIPQSQCSVRTNGCTCVAPWHISASLVFGVSEPHSVSEHSTCRGWITRSCSLLGTRHSRGNWKLITRHGKYNRRWPTVCADVASFPFWFWIEHWLLPCQRMC